MLLAALHLDDEVVAALVGAVDVENDVLLELAVSDLLLREVGDVGDDARVGGKGLVEECDEQFLVAFGSEDALETEVRERTDVIGLKIFCIHVYRICAAKIARKILINNKKMLIQKPLDYCRKAIEICRKEL